MQKTTEKRTKERERMAETFSESEVDGEITYQLYVNGKLACEAVLLGRNCLANINSYPPKQGHGTKMLEYLEKKALENGFAFVEVLDIKDDKDVKGFLEKRGYDLRPHPRIEDEFVATKKLVP
jgi:hypothetical protein